MKDSAVDPVAEVLLDFQAVMAQFLELQTTMISAFAHGHRRTDAATALSPASPDAAETASAAVAQPVSPAAAALAGAPAHAAVEPAAHSSAPASPHVDPGPAPLPAEAVVVPSAIESDAAHSRYTIAIRERARGTARAPLAPDHAVLVTDDGRGIAAIVADRLRREGRRVAIVSLKGVSDPTRGAFASALASVADAEALIEAVNAACGPVAALVHLAPLAAIPSFDRLDAASWSDRLGVETRALFLLTRALGGQLEQAGKSGGAALVAATQMGGAFGAGDTAADLQAPSQGGVAGFVKCAAIELAGVRVRALDLDPSETIDQLAAHVLQELSWADTVTEIGYRRGRRITLEPIRTAAVIDPSFAIPSDAVVLATGGARGITADVCLDLAGRYQPTFVLVGQSPLPPVTEPSDTAGLSSAADVKRALLVRLQSGGVKVTPAMVEKAYRQLLKEREVRETISRLSAAGARVHYVQLDVADPQAFGALVDDIYATYGRLDGVIHGAGIIEDKLIRDKAADSFDRVLRTKAMSAFVLARHIRPETLKFAVLFSSVAGRFGNRGQADYAAANEIVSKLAVLLQRKWQRRVCAIAWAPWDKLGMVSPELKKEFARRGVELLSPAAGRRALWRELQQSPLSEAEVVVGGHAATPIANDAPLEALPLLRHAMREGSQADAVRFARRLDPAIDFYLNDHRLDGKPVLPLAVATELMAEAAQAAFPDLKVVAVRRLQLFKGIVVDPAPVSIVLTVRSAVHSNDEGLTEVDVEITTPGVAPPVRYRSVVQMAARPLEAPAFTPPAWPLVPLSRTVERAYADWTFHGPLFQRVTEIAGIGSDAMVGTIYAPTATPVVADVGRPEWIIDPFVFDSALQLLLMWSRAQNDKTALPSRFHAFRRYGSLSDQPLTAYVEVESLAGGHALKSTVHFVNPTGAIVGVLEGMEASCTNALNRLAGDGREEHRP